MVLTGSMYQQSAAVNLLNKVRERRKDYAEIKRTEIKTEVTEKIVDGVKLEHLFINGARV